MEILRWNKNPGGTFIFLTKVALGGQKNWAVINITKYR